VQKEYSACTFPPSIVLFIQYIDNVARLKTQLVWSIGLIVKQGFIYKRSKNRSKDLVQVVHYKA
jgi:hypothetical protein